RPFVAGDRSEKVRIVLCSIRRTVRPHTSVVAGQNLWELGWKVTMHPYRPDVTPSLGEFEE
ncbi:hypothetical protein WA026_011325, partial [Henosepilachna vigintioctopunctata]